MCACTCSLWPGWAGRPPGRVLVHLTFHPAFLSSCLARPPPGWACPFLVLSFLSLLSWLSWLLFPYSSFPFAPAVPPLSRAFFGFWPWVPSALALCGFLAAPGPPLLYFFSPPRSIWFAVCCPPPSPPSCFSGFRRAVLFHCSDPCGLGLPLACPFVFLLSFRGAFFLWLPLRHRSPVLSSVSGPGCLGPRRCAVSLPPPPHRLLFPFPPSPAVWLVCSLLPPALVSLFSFPPFFWFFFVGFRCPPPPHRIFPFSGVSSAAPCVLPLLFCFLSRPWLLPCGRFPAPPLEYVSPLLSRFRSASCSFPLLCCSCLLACGSRRLPPHPVCALCLVLPGFAVLRRPSVWCSAMPCWRVLCCVSW